MAELNCGKIRKKYSWATFSSRVDYRLNLGENNRGSTQAQKCPPKMGLWRSWERASMAWKRSSVRSRPGPPILQQRSGPTLEALAREDERHAERTARMTAILRDDVVDRRITPKTCRFRSHAGMPNGPLT